MAHTYLISYLRRVPENNRSSAAIAYLAALDHIGKENPEVSAKIVQELKDQRSHLKLIGSENFLAVQLSMGNLLTDKYAEGYPFTAFMPAAIMSTSSKMKLSSKQNSFLAASMPTCSRIPAPMPTSLPSGLYFANACRLKKLNACKKNRSTS